MQGSGQPGSGRSTSSQFNSGVRPDDVIKLLQSGEVRDFTLIAQDGRIWTSGTDQKYAHQALKRAVEQVEPQTT